MKLLFLLVSVIFFSGSTWLTNFEEAQKVATEKKELILLNFSGSDWCGPCMRMRKEIFESADFNKYAEDHLVLLNADFPRNRKNKLSKEQESQNEKLADKYNPEGKFPFTVLLTATGNVLRTWDGLPELKPAEFTHQIALTSGTAK